MGPKIYELAPSINPTAIIPQGCWFGEKKELAWVALLNIK